MALDLSDKDPKDLTREEILYLQDRDRLPEGVEPIKPEDREGGEVEIVATATGSATVPKDQVDKFTGRDGSDQQDVEVVEVDSYDQLSVEDLKAELKDRKLPTTGNKDELVARLEADDASKG